MPSRVTAMPNRVKAMPSGFKFAGAAMPPQKSCSACAHPAAREVGLCRARADKQTQRVQERVVLF